MSEFIDTHLLSFLLFSIAIPYMLVAKIQENRPPKPFNAFYGYRTKRSKQSKEHWHAAQIISSKVMFLMGLTMIALGAIALFIPISEYKSLFLFFTLMIASIVGMFWYTEKCLKTLND